MSRTLRRWRWPLMAGLGAGGLFLFAPILWGQQVGMPADTTWFQFFVVTALGAALVLWLRMQKTATQQAADAREVKQALLGMGQDDRGLFGDVKDALQDIADLKAARLTEDGHRQNLGASVSRTAQDVREYGRRLDKIETYLHAEGSHTGRPFDPVQFHLSREAEAG